MSRLTLEQARQAARPRSVMSRGTCSDTFSIMWNKCCVTIRAGVPFSAEPGFRELLEAADKPIVWE